MDNDRYEKLLRYLASALARWRFDEDFSIEEMAAKLHMGDERAKRALLAEDWSPTMETIARLEDELGEDLLTVPRNKNFK